MATFVRAKLREMASMRYTKMFVLAAALGGILTLPALADAQSRGHAVPRGGGGGGGSVHAGRPPGGPGGPGGPHVAAPYYYRSYGPRVSLGLYYGYPWGWGSFGYGWGYPYYGYYGGYAYPGYGYGGAYLQPGSGGAGYGGVRIDVPQKNAEVWVDGYFAGSVDDFNGRTQQLDLERGAHHLELRAPGFETVSFDVNVEPGRTITYRSALRPERP